MNFNEFFLKLGEFFSDQAKAVAEETLAGGSESGLNRVVKFGGQDLSGEFFTNQTDYGDLTEPKVILFDHGVSGKIVSKVPIGHFYPVVKADGIYADGVHLWDDEFDDDGFIQSLVGRREDYLSAYARVGREKVRRVASAVKRALEGYENLLGWSSGADPNTVIRDGNEIVRWHIVEASYTPVPAEIENEAVKSIFEPLGADMEMDMKNVDGVSASGDDLEKRVGDIEALLSTEVDDGEPEVTDDLAVKAVALIRDLQAENESLRAEVDELRVKASTGGKTFTAVDELKSLVSGSVVGRSETKTDGRSAYGKDKPKSEKSTTTRGSEYSSFGDFEGED